MRLKTLHKLAIDIYINQLNGSQNYLSVNFNRITAPLFCHQNAHCQLLNQLECGE